MSTPNIPVQIVFKDLDDNLIMNRKANAYWFDRDPEFLKLSIDRDAKTKGVKILKTDYVYSGCMLVTPKAGGTITCIVDYLGRKK